MVLVVLFCAAGDILGAQRGRQSHFGVGDGGGLEFDRQHFTFENNTMGCLFQKEVYSAKADLSSKESYYEENFNVNCVESMNYVDSVCSTSFSRFIMDLNEVSSRFDDMAGVVRIGTSLSSMMGTSEWHGQCLLWCQQDLGSVFGGVLGDDPRCLRWRPQRRWWKPSRL